MIYIADEYCARSGLPLKVALEAKIRIALQQQLVVHGTMNGVTSCAAFANGFMLEHEWPPLCNMAFAALRSFIIQRSASGKNSVGLVRFVTIRAGHLAFKNRMTVRETKSSFYVKMALKAYLRVACRIYHRLVPPAGLHMKAARSMTTFATDVESVCTLSNHAGMSGCAEAVHKVFMARCALSITNKISARDGRSQYKRLVESAT